jgi:Cu(I)/Ag(I) efflux system membrane protein CusA/SilA
LVRAAERFPRPGGRGGYACPAMTMEFEVADKKMLDNLKPGAKVQFEFKEKSKGKYVVTDIKP